MAKRKSKKDRIKGKLRKRGLSKRAAEKFARRAARKKRKKK